MVISIDYATPARLRMYSERSILKQKFHPVVAGQVNNFDSEPRNCGGSTQFDLIDWTVGKSGGSCSYYRNSPSAA